MSAAGWIFLWTNLTLIGTYLAVLWVDDWHTTRSFWRDQARRQGRLA